jgi:hypothetical protein
MQSALGGVLDRFAPTQGERDEAQSDFRRLLAQAFHQACEARPSPAAAPTDQAR